MFAWLKQRSSFNVPPSHTVPSLTFIYSSTRHKILIWVCHIFQCWASQCGKVPGCANSQRQFQKSSQCSLCLNYRNTRNKDNYLLYYVSTVLISKCMHISCNVVTFCDSIVPTFTFLCRFPCAMTQCNGLSISKTIQNRKIVYKCVHICSRPCLLL